MALELLLPTYTVYNVCEQGIITALDKVMSSLFIPFIGSAQVMSNLYIHFIGSAQGCFRVRILYWPFHRGCFICSKCPEIKYLKTTRSLLTSTSFSGRRLWSTLLGDRRNLPFPNSSTLSDYQYFRCVTTLSNSSFPSILSPSLSLTMPCLSVFHFSSLLLYMKLWSTFQVCLSTLYLYFSPSPIPFLSLPFTLCFKSVLFSSFPLCHLFVEIETHSHIQLPTVPEIYLISPSRMEHSVYTGRNLVSTNNKTYHWVSWPSLSIVRTSHSAACTPTACGVPERTVDLYTLSSWQYDWCFIAPPDNVILDKDIGGGGGGGCYSSGPPSMHLPLPRSYLKLAFESWQPYILLFYVVAPLLSLYMHKEGIELPLSSVKRLNSN